MIFQRRSTKKQSVILDHWGKGGPLVVDPAIINLGRTTGVKEVL